MPTKDALHLAEEQQRYFDEMMDAAEALAMIAEVLPDVMTSLKASARPALRLVAKNLSYRHGWVSCGPIAPSWVMTPARA